MAVVEEYTALRMSGLSDECHGWSLGSSLCRWAAPCVRVEHPQPRSRRAWS